MTKSAAPTLISLAGAILEHPELGLLLQLRDAIAPTFPHHWGLFGGHIEANEAPDVAIWRELEEELQLRPEMVSSWRLEQNVAHPSGGRVYIFHMLLTVTTDDLVLGEGESMQFIKIADLNPPQPYDGHPFTSFTVDALTSFLATRSALSTRSNR